MSIRFLKSLLVATVLLTASGECLLAESSETRPVIPGKFGWADVYATQVDSTAAFYTQLFDWTTETLDGGYRVFKRQGESVAGLAQRPKMTASESGGMTARWVPYIASSNIAASSKRARTVGADVIIPPTVLKGRGEYTLLRDGQGAYVGLVRPNAGSKPDELAQIGDWIYARLFSPNPEQAADFYADAFGYDVIPDDSTLNEADYVLIADGYNRGGILPLPKDSTKPALWVGFVRVKDIDGAVMRAVSLGGAVLIKPQPDLLGGHLAIVADPEGAPIGLFEKSIQ